MLINLIQGYRFRLAIIWSCVILGLAIFAGIKMASGVHFVSNILSLLPKDDRFPFQQQVEKNAQSLFDNQVIYLIETGTPQFEENYRAFVAVLHRLTDEHAIRVKEDKAFLNEYDQWFEYFSGYRYNLLAPETKILLQENRAAQLTNNQIKKMYSPVSVGAGLPFKEDPFSLFEEWILSQNKTPGMVDVTNLEFSYQRENKSYKPVAITFAGDAFSESHYRNLQSLFQEAENTLDAPTQQYFRAGLVFHTMAGAEQAKREISSIGVASVIAIVVLFVIAYRSVTPLVYTLAALFVGWLNAFSICLLVFKNIHLVTLAFGASLIGVSVDYCFHYFSSKKEFGRADKAINAITTAIFIGLASSVFAYGAQLLTPFPGLQQLAVFACVGLISVWLTVVLILPLIDRHIPAKTVSSEKKTITTLSEYAVFRKLRWLLVLLIAPIGLAGLLQLSVNDDVRLLQTSPSDLIKEDALVRSIMGRQGGGRYFVVHAQAAEALLLIEERLTHALDAHVAKGELSSYEAMTRVLPSIETQRENFDLLGQHIYSEGGQLHSLFNALGLETEETGSLIRAFRRAENKFITPEEWKTALSDNPQTKMYLGRITNSRGDSAYVSLVNVFGATPTIDLQKLPENLGLTDNVYFIDKAAFISSLLKRYRIEMTVIALVAYLSVFALLFLRYKLQVLKVVSPVLLASALVLGAFGVFDIAINLFCIFGFLLVLGVGLDIGIFLQESCARAHARQAVSLSAITTMLAFGLLALSNTPVLHYFGIVVLPGIALAWLFSLVLFTAQSDEHGIPR